MPALLKKFTAIEPFCLSIVHLGTYQIVRYAGTVTGDVVVTPTTLYIPRGFVQVVIRLLTSEVRYCASMIKVPPLYSTPLYVKSAPSLTFEVLMTQRTGHFIFRS